MWLEIISEVGISLQKIVTRLLPLARVECFMDVAPNIYRFSPFEHVITPILPPHALKYTGDAHYNEVMRALSHSNELCSDYPYFIHGSFTQIGASKTCLTLSDVSSNIVSLSLQDLFAFGPIFPPKDDVIFRGVAVLFEFISVQHNPRNLQRRGIAAQQKDPNEDASLTGRRSSSFASQFGRVLSQILVRRSAIHLDPPVEGDRSTSARRVDLDSSRSRAWVKPETTTSHPALSSPLPLNFKYK